MKDKKKVYVICGVIGAVLLGVLIYFAATYLPRLQTGKEIADALQPMLEAENQSMKLDVAADFGGELVNFDADIYLVKEDETKYLVFEQNGYPLYLVDNVLFLENGKAYKIADQMQTQVVEYEGLFLEIAAAYEIFEITKTETDTEVCYEVTVTGEQVKALLAAVMPTENELLGDIESLQVKMITTAGVMDQVEVSGSANVNGAAVQIAVTISDFKVLEDGEYAIPELVKESVKTVDKDSLFSLTEDLYRLLLAVNEFSDFENISGRAILKANLGVLEIDKEVDLAQLKEGLSDVENPTELKELPALVAFLCLEGDITCVEDNGAYIYTLSLNQDSMKKIASSIAPEIVNYVVKLTVGVAEVIVEDGTVSSMRIDIRGNLNLLLTELPIEVGAEFIFSN